MNWTYRIREQNKVALALGAVFIIIVLANWWVSYSMKEVSNQFKSVYQDRLVPALDIAAMQERYYQNLMLLEEHMQAQSKEQELHLQAKFNQNIKEVDSLLAKYETTLLTQKEAEDLQEFKAALRQLTELQHAAMNLSQTSDKAAASSMYTTEVVPAFNQMLLPLHALSKLQQEVGHELYASAEKQLSSLKTLSYLVIALAVILALLVGALLQTSRSMKHIKPQKFHLN
ncbi:MCP four helix bundle domain-containing protein [Pontibacter pamirensis]|uniref:MCP four helix bundle domain-containing protein n=1 Tax=Pontibacter pamirensis TaxID=2562824 RepID=UPI001389FE02|nr:MCP four helix bundle domain-containing protein [Pontibacter pamirensis]